MRRWRDRDERAAIVAFSPEICESSRMDRRALAILFRERLAALTANAPGGLARLSRDAGVDRSALSQFLAEGADRLPRAETLRAIAAARGVSADWLLGLSNAAQGGQTLAASVEIESAFHADGSTPLDRWRREAAGAKLRYVPASLPDMLRLPELMDWDAPGPADADRAGALLDDARFGDLDIEIAMPRQTLADLARGAGVWEELEPALRARQLAHMADQCAAHYPRLRLHLHDGRRVYSAPFTVFGLVRAALYLGRSYLVVTAADEVRALARHFDLLVRDAETPAARAHETLRAFAEAVDGAAGPG
jgi:transcriptional regulator with XRE-family HTH domain